MAIEVTLRQLRAFITVLECGSFSVAADTMHLSQAALSGLVKELESRLGVRLLDRNTRSVSASVVGTAFEPMVRRVLSDLDEALANVTNLKELRRGLVRVAAPETLSCTLLPELIAGYGERHPGVDIRFDDVPIEQVLANLHNGSADIGFGPAGVLADEAVQAHLVRVDPLWAALRPDDPLAAGKSVSWKALRERPLINYMPNLSRNVLGQVPARLHPEQIVPVHRVNTALSLLHVRPGYVICPSMARSLVEGFGLVFVPLCQPAVNWRIALFARSRPSLSPAVESFLDYVLATAQTDGNSPAPRGRAAAVRGASARRMANK
ncbi:LysR family transcriptional regulator [Bordetella petrii]|uniref:Transcriptional regulator, LysR-family n=1 Tax=Bordetella petrii (strain ATCC BAA-461 / DSM 12804 / CCUG 43448 / CIP 107267 / Se-1111R) TaxID=340100 RepID=A9ISQ5_BORPD|nr:LysR family transcriptional regulator [Bordetella petrii]CAP43330.1 transcriptional regulator, LysR-family [Bordetella petrii]